MEGHSGGLFDDDEYETVIYKGPGIPYEFVETSKYSSNESAQQTCSLQPMNVKLAQTSANYGGLLSPDFFQSPAPLSPESSRNSNTNFASQDSHNGKTPFLFPKTEINSRGEHGNNATHSTCRIERVEILEDIADETEWEEWPKTFIEKKGYCLGIQPGHFYKNQSFPSFYVKLPHRSNYEILVTNNNQVPCDLDLYSDGHLTNALRLPPGVSRSIDGPAYSKSAFKLFRTKEAPPDKNVKEGLPKNGVIEAIFTPKKMESSRFRAASEPLCSYLPIDNIVDMLEGTEDIRKPRSYTSGDQDKVERSLDMSQVSEGVTLLQGKKKKKHYVPAPEMETDSNKRVILRLRLIASLDEELAETEEEIYALQPPPLPK